MLFRRLPVLPGLGCTMKTLLILILILVVSLPTGLAVSAPGLPVQVPVLVLAYYPPDPAAPAYLDPIETGWTNVLIADMQSATQAMVEAGQALINDASRYHGYKDLAAPQYLAYFTDQKLEYFEPMPRGYKLDLTAYRPNYHKILSEVDICSYVDLHGVKEIWIYGYHSTVIAPDESKMSSRYGDVSNAYPKEESLPEEFRLPRCMNSYVLYNFTYQPGGALAIGNTIHNRLHQIENVLFFAENQGYPANETNVAGSLFWDDISVYGNRASLPGYQASCGNTHSPPNTLAAYDYTSLAYQENNCETWHPDDNQTTYVLANCTQWGCSDTGFYKWFMQNLPGYNNGLSKDGLGLRNWWEAMVDFNRFIDGLRSLYDIPQAKVHLPLVQGDYQPDQKPRLVQPLNGEILAYASDWLFEAEPLAGAQGFLWDFFQRGSLVWENYRDEGSLSGEQYTIPVGSTAHSLLLPGSVEVWVRAWKDGKWTEATKILIYLQ